MRHFVVRQRFYSRRRSDRDVSGRNDRRRIGRSRAGTDDPRVQLKVMTCSTSECGNGFIAAGEVTATCRGETTEGASEGAARVLMILASY